MSLRATLTGLVAYAALAVALGAAVWGCWLVVEAVRFGRAYYVMAIMFSFGLSLVAGLLGLTLRQRANHPSWGLGMDLDWSRVLNR
ncbi:hypothetical protein ACFPYI_14055 [Halomarina salina]|uniref:Uncharacterized protein n=1 Tax=Halomarina salina TaxID=1872699 RepID=A0ABD5RQH8_9EURY|nr:hypothetical protein [Halomarina salina]